MEKLRESSNRGLWNRRDIMHWKPRKHWSTVYPISVYLCLLATASSRLWCTPSTAQSVPVPPPAVPPTASVPTVAPEPTPTPLNPTDPVQLTDLYRLNTWPEVWRLQRGTVPNINNLTDPNRDPCTSGNWGGIQCDKGSPFQSIIEITVVDMAGGYPANFLQVMSNLTTLQTLRIYQKGDHATSSLGGTIPASLGRLINLQVLNFRGNQLTGSVPAEVARLPKLVTINLADNQLSGPIDQFCESTSLQSLLLFNNHFSQAIPPCLGNLNLTNLNIGANNITGPIPASFVNLVNMQTINVDNTTLTGGLPNSIVAAWTQLTSLSFLRSNLSGPIPDAIGSLKMLTNLQLGMNELSGGIPPSLGNLDSLSALSLYDNRLTGKIPAELGGMKNLTSLLLYRNSFTGSMPSSLGRLSMLQHVHLQGNNFSGGIDGRLFANWTRLKGLFLQENNFNGTFPSHDIFNSCTSLANVSLSYNNFNGPVLEPNTRLPSNLSLLLMSYNNFSGPIPSAMGESMSTNLRFLDLANNSLTGAIPTEVTNKASTAQINLSFNSLNVSNQPSKPEFGLFNCHPQDASCTEYHAGTSKGVAINVGGPAYADFEADVQTPENAVGMFTRSTSSTWSLSTTGVDGGSMINQTQPLTNEYSIPFWTLYSTARTGADSFTYYIHALKPRSNYKVDLGFAELVPDMRRGERVFDIWIQGQLAFHGMDVMARAPDGQFWAFVETFDAKTFGDTGLMTVELRGHGSWPLVFNKRFKQGQYRGPILSSLRVYQATEVSKRPILGTVMGFTAGGVVLALAFLLLGVVFLKRRRKLQILNLEHSGLGLTFFRYSELEAATSKWSAQSLIGEGAFGKVYRGVLSDDTIVAIKQLVVKADGPLWTKEAFLNEARIISTTRHRNLIALLGCCFESSNPMFICEYMPNGSLHDALFVEKITLNWAQRVAIARDVASGLLYLHEETANRIIHRDVKPANILLDEKMNARVADFGLARLVGDQEIDVITNVMGTRGYLAPEYALNGQLSDKVDVYSYGVVLLELVSGRHGLQPSRDLPLPVPISMVQWTWDMVADGHILGVADPDLDRNFFNEDFIRIVEIGLWCTQSHPQMRPSMNQVKRMLLKQARVPKLIERTVNYEARDFKNLPVNPFDKREWPSYMAEISVGKQDKQGTSSFKSTANPTSSVSFDNGAVLSMSGVVPR